MPPLETKLTAFITSLSLANADNRPTLYRTDSASTFASESSSRTGEITELKEWKYGHKRAYSEQDEVKRKRIELAEKRRRASIAAWREFWP